MNRLHPLMTAVACRAIEPRIRVMMLKITHMIDVPRTMHSKIRHNRGIDNPSLIDTGKTLTGRPASGLAGQLAHALVAAIGVSVASLISENT